MGSMNNNLTQSLMRILSCYIDPYKDTEYKKVSPEVIEPIFIFALTWSVGATIDSDSRERFDLFIKKTIELKKTKVQIAQEGQIYDFQFNEKNKQFESWTESFKDFEVD